MRPSTDSAESTLYEFRFLVNIGKTSLVKYCSGALKLETAIGAFPMDISRTFSADIIELKQMLSVSQSDLLGRMYKGMNGWKTYTSVFSSPLAKNTKPVMDLYGRIIWRSALQPSGMSVVAAFSFESSHLTTRLSFGACGSILSISSVLLGASG